MQNPRVSPFVGSVVRTQCSLRSAVSCNSFVVSSLQPLAALFALFSALPPFVFNHFQPLSPKHPGWGGIAHPECSYGTPGAGVPPSSPFRATSRRPKVGQPFLAVLPRSPKNSPPQSSSGPMTSKPALLCKPPVEYLHFHLRTSNLYSPKWDIIPAPASATRLRGRSV